jgi:hypothetical protein
MLPTLLPLLLSLLCQQSQITRIECKIQITLILSSKIQKVVMVVHLHVRAENFKTIADYVEEERNIDS